MRFVYSLIRFVPDPARGEFVNVGAIVGSEESCEWQVRQVSNPVRARAFDDGSLLEGVWSFVDQVGHQIDSFEEGAAGLFEAPARLDEAWLETLYQDHRNIVQLSPPTPMAAASADEAMDLVFETRILDPATRRHRFQSKQVARGAIRRAYAAGHLGDRAEVTERVQLRTLHHRELLDFAIINGRVLQLTQAFSFQVPDQRGLTEQVRAWGWALRETREAGGSVTVRGNEFEVPKTVDIEVVYVPPLPGHDAPALTDAKAVFEALAAVAHPVSDAAGVATRARQLLTGAPTGGRGAYPDLSRKER